MVNKSKCCICGELCSGKMKIQVRKNKTYTFCTIHFRMYEFESLEVVRDKIKENRLLLKSYNTK